MIMTEQAFIVCSFFIVIIMSVKHQPNGDEHKCGGKLEQVGPYGKKYTQCYCSKCHSGVAVRTYRLKKNKRRKWGTTALV
jgi:hypothetical protein